MITQQQIDDVVASIGFTVQGDWIKSELKTPSGSFEFKPNKVHTLEGLRRVLLAAKADECTSIVWRIRPMIEVDTVSGEPSIYFRFATVPDYDAKWAAAVHAADAEHWNSAPKVKSGYIFNAIGFVN